MIRDNIVPGFQNFQHKTLFKIACFFLLAAKLLDSVEGSRDPESSVKYIKMAFRLMAVVCAATSIYKLTRDNFFNRQPEDQEGQHNDERLDGNYMQNN